MELANHWNNEDLHWIQCITSFQEENNQFWNTQYFTHEQKEFPNFLKYWLIISNWVLPQLLLDKSHYYFKFLLGVICLRLTIILFETLNWWLFKQNYLTVCIVLILVSCICKIIFFAKLFHFKDWILHFKFYWWICLLSAPFYFGWFIDSWRS